MYYLCEMWRFFNFLLHNFVIYCLINSKILQRHLVVSAMVRECLNCSCHFQVAIDCTAFAFALVAIVCLQKESL